MNDLGMTGPAYDPNNKIPTSFFGYNKVEEKLVSSTTGRDNNSKVFLKCGQYITLQPPNDRKDYYFTFSNEEDYNNFVQYSRTLKKEHPDINIVYKANVQEPLIKSEYQKVRQTALEGYSRSMDRLENKENVGGIIERRKDPNLNVPIPNEGIQRPSFTNYEIILQCYEGSRCDKILTGRKIEDLCNTTTPSLYTTTTSL